jgi:RNA polymerase sigma-70 factor (ECF subfamily)
MQVLNEELDAEQARLVELVRAAQEGDREAFGDLVARFEPAVFNTALRRLGNYAEAQELCQEVFVKAMEKIEQLKAPEAFGGWLKSITIRMAINRVVRGNPATSAEPEVLAASCISAETPLDSALAREQQRRVRAGLRRLGDLDRKTLTAFYFKGQSLVEMSEAFDSPVGTIKRRLHVARKRLAEELESLAV